MASHDVGMSFEEQSEGAKPGTAGAASFSGRQHCPRREDASPQPEGHRVRKASGLERLRIYGFLQ